MADHRPHQSEGFLGYYGPRGSQRRVRRRFWLEFTAVPNDTAATGRQPEDEQGQAADADAGAAEAGFPQFERLPAEIRLQIWEAAACLRRVIAVTCHAQDLPEEEQASAAEGKGDGHAGGDGDARDGSGAAAKWSPPAAELPALMCVCREAYSVAHKVYERAFAWRLPYTLAEVRAPISSVRAALQLQPGGGAVVPIDRPRGAGCWFNFDNDILLLRGELEPRNDAVLSSLVHFLPADAVVRVRHVVIDATAAGLSSQSGPVMFSRLFPILDFFRTYKKQSKFLTLVTPSHNSPLHQQLLGSAAAHLHKAARRPLSDLDGAWAESRSARDAGEANPAAASSDIATAAATAEAAEVAADHAAWVNLSYVRPLVISGTLPPTKEGVVAYENEILSFLRHGDAAYNATRDLMRTAVVPEDRLWWFLDLIERRFETPQTRHQPNTMNMDALRDALYSLDL